MNQEVKRRFDKLQDDLLQLLDELDKAMPGQLETQRSNGKWSVTQVMYHLNSAESLSVKYVSKKRLAAPQLKRTGPEAQLRLWFARIAFYVPLKYPAPKLLGTMPLHVPYEEMKQTWLKTRSELSILLDTLTDEEIYKPIFKQPFFGRWNIFQMLGFMQTHFNRHRRQMRERLKQ